VKVCLFSEPHSTQGSTDLLWVGLGVGSTEEDLLVEEASLSGGGYKESAKLARDDDA
jgi:hypothetical protein